MLTTIPMQIRLVVFSLIAGMLTGILFDFYRVIRGFENPNKYLTFIQDTLFWIFTTIIIFVFLLFTNYAYMGMYAYLWIAIGIYIYLKVISKTFITIQYNILKTLGKVFRITKNFIVYPFSLVIHKLKRKGKKKEKKKKKIRNKRKSKKNNLNKSENEITI